VPYLYSDDETEKYLKFSGNYFEDVLSKFDDYSGELFPEVTINEDEYSGLDYTACPVIGNRYSGAGNRKFIFLVNPVVWLVMDGVTKSAYFIFYEKPTSDTIDWVVELHCTKKAALYVISYKTANVYNSAIVNRYSFTASSLDCSQAWSFAFSA